MTIEEILHGFYSGSTISAEAITAIQIDDGLRKDLISYFRKTQDRIFALALLDKFVSIRQLPDGIMPVEDLMLACYVLALHNHIEDSLKIWEAKTTDFDTYCGLDIQLIVFAGVKETLDFLSRYGSDDAKRAFDYVKGCSESGDFNDIDEYFSDKKLPWFI